jgi:hypothetical protein
MSSAHMNEPQNMGNRGGVAIWSNGLIDSLESLDPKTDLRRFKQYMRDYVEVAGRHTAVGKLVKGTLARFEFVRELRMLGTANGGGTSVGNNMPMAIPHLLMDHEFFSGSGINREGADPEVSQLKLHMWITWMLQQRDVKPFRVEKWFRREWKDNMNEMLTGQGNNTTTELADHYNLIERCREQWRLALWALRVWEEADYEKRIEEILRETEGGGGSSGSSGSSEDEDGGCGCAIAAPTATTAAPDAGKQQQKQYDYNFGSLFEPLVWNFAANTGLRPVEAMVLRNRKRYAPCSYALCVGWVFSPPTAQGISGSMAGGRDWNALPHTPIPVKRWACKVGATGSCVVDLDHVHRTHRYLNPECPEDTRSDAWTDIYQLMKLVMGPHGGVLFVNRMYADRSAQLMDEWRREHDPDAKGAVRARVEHLERCMGVWRKALWEMEVSYVQNKKLNEQVFTAAYTTSSSSSSSTTDANNNKSDKKKRALLLCEKKKKEEEADARRQKRRKADVAAVVASGRVSSSSSTGISGSGSNAAANCYFDDGTATTTTCYDDATVLCSADFDDEYGHYKHNNTLDTPVYAEWATATTSWS